MWGSTYLAIGYAVDSIPPFFMAGFRFLGASFLLYAYMRYVKGERVTRKAVKPAAIMGALLLLGGNGGVCYAQQTLPSGITALMVGAGPFWFVLLGWLWLKGPRPGLKAVLGLIVGFIGLVILIGPGNITGTGEPVPLLPALVVVAAALSWSVGSIYSKTITAPASPMMMAALQMFFGSGLLMAAGLLHNEHNHLHFENITTASWLSFLYLIIFGSLVGFSAYIYVLRHASPAVASTYAYVNPVVAVIVGWAVGGEALASQTIIAAALIIGAVILISWPARQAPSPPEAPEAVVEPEDTGVVAKVEQTMP